VTGVHLEGVQTAVRAESHHGPNCGGAREAFFARFRDDPFVQQPALVTVALTDEDAQQMTFFR
jgi:hypothetical protein